MSADPRLRGVLVEIGLALFATVLVLAGQALAQSRRGEPQSPPKSAKTAVAQGQQELASGRFLAAAYLLSAAIKAEPGLAEAYYLRGRAYDHLGKPANAIADYSRYIDLRPSDPRGYILRGDAHNFNLEHDRAVHDYNMALQLAPKSVPAHLGRGLAHAALEQYEKAIGDYRCVLDTEPRNPEALANMGLVFARTGRIASALVFLEQARKLEKNANSRKLIEEWIAKLDPTQKKAEKQLPGQQPIRRPW